MMHDREKSDSAIVAGKLTNKAGQTGRGAGGAKGGGRGEREPAKHTPGTVPGDVCHRRWNACGKSRR